MERGPAKLDTTDTRREERDRKAQTAKAGNRRSAMPVGPLSFPHSCVMMWTPGPAPAKPAFGKAQRCPMRARRAGRSQTNGSPIGTCQKRLRGAMILFGTRSTLDGIRSRIGKVRYKHDAQASGYVGTRTATHSLARRACIGVASGP